MTTLHGDVTINSVPYRIDIPSYKVRDMVDFSPRAATPGGSVIHSELGLYQPLLQTDWRHGFGFQWYEDAMGYLSSTGNIDTRQAGLAMLFTSPTVSDTTAGIKEGHVLWNNCLWSWGAAGLHKYTGASATTVWTTPYTTGPVNFALATKDYLFYCPDGARIRKVATSDTHSDAGKTTDSVDYKWLVIHNGNIFAGIDNSNRVHRGSADDLSDLEGTAADTNKIIVGAGGLPTLGAAVYSSKLFVFRQDGIWNIGDDYVARKVLDFSSEASADNFRGYAVHNGYLVFTVRDKIYQWNGSRIQNITPPKLTDVYPYVMYGRYDNFITIGDYMYCTGRTNETEWTESVLCWDGVGWNKLCDPVSTDNDYSITSIGYDTKWDRMWYNVHKSTATIGDVTSYIQFNTQSIFPYGQFATSGTHNIITSRLDMGYRRVYKSMPSIIVEASNIEKAHHYLKIYYSLDNGVWVLWGDIENDGVTILETPGGLRTVEFYFAQIKVEFITDDATQTPVLEGLTVRFILRPEVFYGWNFNIIGAEGYEYGAGTDDRTPSAIFSTLKTARDSKAPIQFIDAYGDTWYTYVTAVTLQALERHDEEEHGTVNIENVINVNLSEVA